MRHRNHLSIIQLVIVFLFHKLLGAAALTGKYLYDAGPAFDSVVSIAYINTTLDLTQNHFCSGTLITNQLILTTNECALNCGRFECAIHVGSFSLGGTFRTYSFEEWTPYENWSIKYRKSFNKFTDNLAIIKLKERVEGVLPRDLVQDWRSARSGSLVHLVGFSIGKINGSNQYRLYRQTAMMKILSKKICEERVRIHASLANLDLNKMICTESLFIEGNAALTGGDAGAPIFDKEFHLVGVNQASTPFISNSSNVKPTNLHSYLKFYEEFIRKQLSLKNNQ